MSTQPNAAKDAFKIMMRRLNHQNPHVLLHTLTVSHRPPLSWETADEAGGRGCRVGRSPPAYLSRLVSSSYLVVAFCGSRPTVPSFPDSCLHLFSPDYHSFLETQLLDACVSNCGKRFHLEVCSREFENEAKRLLTKAPHVKVGEKLLQLIKKWAEAKEFADDPQLNLIPTLYRSLKKEGYIFSTPESGSKRRDKLPTDPNVVTSNQEEEDIAKAIAESLKVSESKSYGSGSSSKGTSGSSASSVYPTFEADLTNGSANGGRHVNSKTSSSASSSSYQVRALYDFEAAEDNELTFKAGEIIVVLDDR